jgi:hypothetical protein
MPFRPRVFSPEKGQSIFLQVFGLTYSLKKRGQSPFSYISRSHYVSIMTTINTIHDVRILFRASRSPFYSSITRIIAAGLLRAPLRSGACGTGFAALRIPDAEHRVKRGQSPKSPSVGYPDNSGITSNMQFSGIMNPEHPVHFRIRNKPLVSSSKKVLAHTPSECRLWPKRAIESSSISEEYHGIYRS